MLRRLVIKNPTSVQSIVRYNMSIFSKNHEPDLDEIEKVLKKVNALYVGNTEQELNQALQEVGKLETFLNPKSYMHLRGKINVALMDLNGELDIARELEKQLSNPSLRK